jgi:alpha-galactosidase
MPKITFMGAGSTVFARNVLGDCMVTDVIKNLRIALYDIDRERLKESEMMLNNINETNNKGRAKIETFLGVRNRKAALKKADFVVNAIQVGGWKPSTYIDFEVPKQFGIRQTIGDTLGIGGIFRGLRTIPVIMDFARDMEEVCPDAWFLNYTNPMAMVTGAVQRYTSVKTVGLCHSWQICALLLCAMLELPSDNLRWDVAGINHQAWLLDISRNGKDLYPEIRKRAQMDGYVDRDKVRFEIMKRFGYYNTESSEHTAEYSPYFIKSQYPELIDEFHIPLDEYPRRCIEQIEEWEELRKQIVTTKKPLAHARGYEYASYIIEAMLTGKPYTIGGNVINDNIITNLPRNACVEVKCVVDRTGIHPTVVGDLPEQLAALNRTNINVHLMTIEAAMTRKRDAAYQAAFLDPHTAAELPMDKIVEMCDALFEAHGNMMPRFK